MRKWSSSTVESMLVQCCAQCPDHKRLTKRSRTTSGRWVTENTCAKCRRTGRQILHLTTIDDHCPLPEYTPPNQPQPLTSSQSSNQAQPLTSPQGPNQTGGL